MLLREPTSVHGWQLDASSEPLVSEHKLLTTFVPNCCFFPVNLAKFFRMFLWNMSKQPGVISSGLKNKLFEKMIKMCLDTIPFFSKNQGCETTMLPEEKLHRFRFLGYLSESIF